MVYLLSFLAHFLLLWTFYFFWFSRWRRRQDLWKEENKRLTQELNAVTHRNLALLEEKIDQLRSLSKVSDQALQTAKYQASQPWLAAEHAVVNREILSSQVPDLLDGKRYAQSYQRTVESLPSSSGEKSDRGINVAEALTTREGRASASEVQVPSLRERALLYHRQGFAPAWIAKALHMATEEVEMILSLEQVSKEN